MEKEELKNHISYQFEKLAEIENVKSELTSDLQKDLLAVFKKHMPKITEEEKEIKNRVNEIYSSALELQESFTCENGRVIYIPAWGGEDKKISVEGLSKVKNANDLKIELMQEPSDEDIIDLGIKTFLLKIQGQGGDSD